MFSDYPPILLRSTAGTRRNSIVQLGTLLFCASLSLVLRPSAATAQTGSPNVVISQVYGGGGNQGATLSNDFVELFNRGGASVDMTGWTLQYAPASGGNWQRTELAGTIQPGQYYLVQEKQGSAGSAGLPTPDAIGGIGLSATSGKVAVVSDSTALSGASPSSSKIVDLVGYGSANFAEGSVAGALTNETAAIRKSGGCVDTNNNSADFDVAAPAPRNTQSPLNPCGTSAGPQITRAGVTNAASFLSGAVAPGELITIFGSDLGPPSLVPLQLAPDEQHVTSELGGTRVLFDGAPAPMIYAWKGQVSAVVPYSVSGRPTTVLEVEYNGARSNSLTLPVAASAPGIFTLDSSGRGSGAILNQDFTLNGPATPAKKGSVVMIYATGGGQTEPASEDGKLTSGAPPRIPLPVAVWIAGAKADVLYAGAAPDMVSGVIQINARVPASLTAGGSVSVQISVGGVKSQPGVTLSVAGSSQWSSTPAIEQKFAQLKTDASVPKLPEIPNDRIGLPPGWLGLISWNIQVGGTSTSPTALRPPMVQAALSKMFSGTYQILAAQEIPNNDSANLLRTLLPGGIPQWNSAFFDTTDSMDNGFWYRPGVTLKDSFPLFVTNQTLNGKLVTDPSRAVHPPVVGQFQVGNFDFTLVTLHLTFANGNTAESARELRNVLDYLDWYFDQPGHDPDVIVCGDFNTPSALSGQTGKNGITLDSIFDQDPRFQTSERRFVVTVHEPTSRKSASSGGVPANNYDHCICSIDTMEEFIQARRVSPSILTDHPEDPKARLTSDHFPVVGFFRTSGDGVMLDGGSQIRPSTSGTSLFSN